MNPLFSDDLVDFLLEEVLDLDDLLTLPAFADHSRETCTLYVDACRRLAREKLFVAYEAMDKETPGFRDGQVALHPKMAPLFQHLVELGVIAATRPVEVGGAQLPVTVASAGNAYLMAANLGATAIIGLTTGAARLIESFGSDDLKTRFMTPMYEGRYTGTMALTEPQAGSSLTDVKTKAVDNGDGTFAISGTKIFISGGEHSLTDNIVHLTLARIEGAPEGIKGVSLFAIPKRREQDGEWVDNDVVCTSVFHKIGWKALPSVQLAFGERSDCRGWLVGEPHRGIKQMFQMMNEARLMVGLNGVASASVAYQASLAYARDRPQGRPLGQKDPAAPQIPIIEHDDVKRMLLRQKAIVEGGLGLLLETAVLTDRAEHHPDPLERQRSHLLLDLLIPIAKTFPAEFGFEANTLAIQVHGGYGYTSEYLPEAWWRDQKLNSLHEGTSGIQAMDLLGRKAVAQGGEALRLLGARLQKTLEGAGDLEVKPLAAAVDQLAATTMTVAAKGLSGDPAAMLRHASDYMEAASVIAVGWMLLEQAIAAQRGQRRSAEFYAGKAAAYRYWLATEVAAVFATLERIRNGETSYADMSPEQF